MSFSNVKKIVDQSLELLVLLNIEQKKYVTSERDNNLMPMACHFRGEILIGAMNITWVYFWIVQNKRFYRIAIDDVWE